MRIQAVEPDTLNTVLVPAGCFQMGGEDGDSDEAPPHQVCLDAFRMDRYEVAQGQYQAVMGESPWLQCSGEMCPRPWISFPAVDVDWEGASAYCAKVGRRLPTEAEFEYANRAGNPGQYPWGNMDVAACIYANVADQSAKRKWGNWITFECEDGYAALAPVGSFQPNAWGLFDMEGNVWEWVEDWFAKNYYALSPLRNPTGPNTGEYRVNRGGSWWDFPEALRAASRNYSIPSYRAANLGFRCVQPVTGK